MRVFFEPGFASGPYEPLWDELDLAEVAAAAPFVPVPQELDNAAPKAASAGEGSPAAKPAVRPQNIERRLIELLGPVPVQVDELARMAEIPVREVRTVLLALKLAGKVEWHGGDLVSSLPTAWPRADYHEE
jgi:DNA processing protein